MQDLDRAINDLEAIRSTLARGAEFRGYGPGTVAATGLLAFGAATVQTRFIAPGNFAVWLALWGATALICAGLIGAEMVRRARRAHLGLADEMVREAALALLPAFAAGAMLTFVLWRYVPAALWMLPGLWQILLSLGVFGACRNLPPAMMLVGFWYFAAGLACLVFAQGNAALCPASMGVPFAVGELLSAALLFVSVKRND
jgi:hypothetical protein